MSYEIPTITIKHPSKPGRSCVINESDFDQSKHKRYDEPAGREMQGTAQEMGTSIELGTDSGEQLSDEQLRDVIETMTGKAPHHKTGRAKLIAEYDALNAATADA